MAGEPALGVLLVCGGGITVVRPWTVTRRYKQFKAGGLGFSEDVETGPLDVAFVWIVGALLVVIGLGFLVQGVEW